MRQNQLHNVTWLKDRRKELRSNLTPAEAKLWSVLKNSSFKNRKFRRQHSIGNFIVDFYCPSEKLIVELDGNGHFNSIQSAYDAERDKQLKDWGNKIIRIENKVVFEDLDYVLLEIERHFGQAGA